MYCIYHSRDLDGMCSGAIVKKKYPDCVMIGYDYGQKLPIDDIKAGEPIIMVDVSMPMKQMVMIGLHSTSQFTWIDHHASAITDFEALQKDSKTQAAFIKPVLQEGIAACEIAWNYFFPDQDMPMAVELLGQYDTFRKNDKHNWNKQVLPFQYGMRGMDVDTAQSFPQDLLNDDVDFEDLFKIIKNGKIILAYQQQVDSANMQSAFEVTFEGYKAIACNGAGLGSMAFDSVPDLKSYDIMMPFKFDGQAWSFSLYTANDDVDCSELAKKYGGGGHKAASGFRIDELPDFIIKHKQ